MIFLGNSNPVWSQVVVNEGFENTCSDYALSFRLGCIPNWIAVSGTPDTRSVYLPPAYQGRFAYMVSLWDGGCAHPDMSEGIALNYAFQSGVNYKISYAAKGFSSANAATQTYTGRWILTNGLVNQSLPPGNCFPSEYTPNIPAGSQSLPSTVFNNSSWTVNTFTFTPTSNFSQIWFRNTQTSSVGNALFGAQMAIDSVVIEKICTPTPSISSPSSFCLGSPISFVGSAPNCTVTNNVWTVVECTSTGGAVTGAVEWWSPWAIGAPGTLTLPSTGGPIIACGKYYRIKLAVVNANTPWSETTRIISINCLPLANGGPNITICKGGCGVVGTMVGPQANISYSWTGPNGNIGNTEQVSVCPTVTTTYTLTVSNGVTGCSAADAVTVNVENNDPAFTLTANLTASDAFYTLHAVPVNTNVSGIPGFGFAWFVDEIVSPANITPVPGSPAANPGCWWGGLITDFSGYNGPAFTLSATPPMSGGCTNPAVGRFTAGHTYRIIRGTWSNSCPWQQFSEIVYMAH